MSAISSTYSIYEGTFLTMAPIMDNSVNILMFRDPDHHEYNIIINRSWLAEEQTPEEYCEKEIESLRNTLPGFQVEGKLLKHELGPAKLPVVQVANNFLQNGERTRQVQSIVLLPHDARSNPDNRAMLIFTLATSAGEFTEYQRKHYVQIINSFNPKVVSVS
ncbi:DcrB-related protein [Yersinia mollaretii]|uniref:DcrB-related protein n=1 Tax=Yersinia mollaretii TaxID=33060 RepID=UPI0011A0F60A|nr:DcrB-related protein [Yersinia mollaretii]